MKVKMRTLGLLFALFMLATQMVFAQATNSADVTGTVTDPTGAVLPGVSVTIKDVDKGLVSTVATNKAGVYDSGPVIPNDHYTITFKRQGFTTLQRGPMVLQVGTTGMNV